MSNAIFPTIPGLTWDTKFTDEFFNLIQTAAAPGFETRLSLGPDPIIHFELNYEFLRQHGFPDGTSTDELYLLRDFWRARQGDFDSFLLSLPTITQNASDGAVTGQVLTPDTNNIAPLMVVRPGATGAENIYEAFGVNGNPGTAPVVKKDATTLVAGTDYNIVGPGFAISGTTYPGLAVQFLITTTGHVMSANFSWYYRVRFEQGSQEFDGFMALLYLAQKIKLMATRTS